MEEAGRTGETPFQVPQNFWQRYFDFVPNNSFEVDRDRHSALYEESPRYKREPSLSPASPTCSCEGTRTLPECAE